MIHRVQEIRICSPDIVILSQLVVQVYSSTVDTEYIIILKSWA